jgi:general secretion pathway protein K
VGVTQAGYSTVPKILFDGTKLMAAGSQRGAALLTAMLVVALAVTLVSGLLWREELRVRTLENQRLRDQAQWLGIAAADWARLILREDLYQTRNVDHLGEVWAVPIAETPLSDFLQSQGGGASVNDADRETWLSGQIVDAASRFNLTSLLEENAPMGDRGWVTATRINLEAEMIFARLLQSAGLDPGGAARVAQMMLLSRQSLTTQGDAPLPISSVQDLLAFIPGATPDALARLAAYTVVLPRPTPVNANTASPMVLAAVLGIDLSQAEQLVADRAQAYFSDYPGLMSQMRQRAPQGLMTTNRNVGVSSEYFWVIERLRHGRVTVTQQALVARRSSPGNATQVLWTRPGLPDGLSLGG